MISITLSELGKYAASKFSFKGIAGVFSDPKTSMGASKYSKQFF